MGLLRVLLAISVLCAHSHPIGHLRWLDGNLSVELFFVVSGFYMQLVLSGKYTKERLGQHWIAQFYKARYFRLFPAYAGGCLFVIGTAFVWRELPLFPAWSYLQSLANTPGTLLFKVFFGFTNATMLFQDVAMFFSSHGGHIHWSANFFDSEYPLWQGLMIPPAWSLGIELSFYLIAPILLRLRSRWLIGGALVGVAAKVAAVSTLHLGDPWTYRFFPFEIAYFLMGALAYRYRTAVDGLLPDNFNRPVAYALAIAITCFRIPVFWPTVIYPVALACVLPVMFRATAASNLDRLFGELSYPFYIFHMQVLQVAAQVFKQHRLPWDPAWAGLLITLFLSALAVAIEARYLEPWRASLSQQRPLKSPGAKSGQRAPPILSARAAKN